MQEQQQAQQQIAGLLAQQQQGGLGAGGLSTQAGLGAAGLQAGLSEAERAAERQGIEDVLTLATGERGLQSQERLARQQMIPGAITGGLQAASSFMPSDERVKNDVRDGDADVRDLFGSLAAKTYRYSDDIVSSGEVTGGDRLGILAQDLERTDLGRSLVREGDDGVKRVDVGQLAGALAAAVASQQKRLDRMEAKADA
jgi:hypothetical protein